MTFSKLSKFVSFASLLALFTLGSCDDNTGSIGIDMMPPTDHLQAHTTLFDVTTRSIKADSVFAKTSTGYVGRFSDADFGFYECSFLTELNCTDNYRFPEVYRYNEATGKASGTMAGDSVVSVQLVIYYSSWFGDSLNACRLSVYELNDRWLEERNAEGTNYRYTSIDGSKYCDNSTLLGRAAYSAYDTSVSDSVRNATDSDGNPTYYPHITIPLDKHSFGEDRILKKYRSNPEYFADAESFINNIFKGVYIKTDQGDGTILYVDRVDLQMQFRFHAVDSLGVKLQCVDGTDSLFYSMNTVFASTKEVIQANRFSNSQRLEERIKEEGNTYLKSPAGIFTEVRLPYDEIYTQLKNDTLNGAKLTFTNYHQESKYDFSMEAPGTVLLLRKSAYHSFFENNEVTDNITSFTATHNSVATNQYVFSNIARLVSNCITEKNNARNEARTKAGSSWNEAAWEAQWTLDNPDWDKVLLIPVSLSYDNNSSQLIGVQHDLAPSYAKLVGGPTGDVLKLEVVSTEIKE